MWALAAGLATVGAWAVATPAGELPIGPRVRFLVKPLDHEGGGPAEGRYRPVPVAQDEALRAEIEALEAIGYLAGSREAGEQSSVSIHEEGAAGGVNLLTSGHGPEALLFDNHGTALHRWSKPLVEVWPERRRAPKQAQFWRRARVLADGGLLGIYEGVGLVRLDRDSEVVWAVANRAHHDLDVSEQGSIWVLTRRAGIVGALNPDKPILDDGVAELAPDGTVLQTFSVLEAYRRSPYEQHWRSPAEKAGDVFHTNSVELLGEVAGAPAGFEAGNLLLSMRNLDTVAVLDPGTGTIVWSQKGPWAKQHDPHLLPGGRLLVFDNRGPEERASRVIEVDIATGEIVWSWAGEEARPLWSATCGTAVRLDNGNTLVTESDGGRALEVAPDGSVVWAFDNPHRPPDKPRFVATAFEVERMDAPSWLEAP
jgi:hypothetical protein